MSPKKILLLLYLVPIAAALCVVSVPALPQTMPMSQHLQGPRGPNSNNIPRFRAHQAVEEKAHLLQDNNQDTYRALADEIFRSPRGFEVLAIAHGIGPTKIPAPIDNVIKDRLVYAEMQYRQGTGKAVTEQNIVDLTNMLVQRFGLPDYARTSPSQVRFMRMFLISVNPSFMGKGAVRPNMQVGESISQEMSPLQAVHLLFEVLGHKFFDPNFQMTPETWDIEQAARSNQTTSSNTKTMHSVTASINPKSNEIRSLLVGHIHSMSPVEAYSLANQALESLGI